MLGSTGLSCIVVDCAGLKRVGMGSIGVDWVIRNGSGFPWVKMG